MLWIVLAFIIGAVAVVGSLIAMAAMDPAKNFGWVMATLGTGGIIFFSLFFALKSRY